MKHKIDFQDGGHGGHLGFPIQMILAIFDLQVNLILPTEFQVSWLLGSKDVQFRFSRWLLWRPSWILSRMILAVFDLQTAPILPTMFWVNWPFRSWEDQKTFSRWPPWGPSWISSIMILAIFDQQVTLILSTKFLVNWPMGVGRVVFWSKLLTPHDAGWTLNDHTGSKFWVSLPFGSGEEAQNRFSRWRAWC